jgi:hypothetical protein
MKTAQTTIPIILSFWLMGAPAFAQDKAADAPPPGETADRLNKIERRLTDLETQIGKLKGADGLAEKLDALQTTVARIRDDIDKMRLYQPPVGPSTAKKPAMGQIQIINSWHRPVWVTLEGTDYLLRPNQTRTITRAPGPFTYEIHEVQAPKTSQLAADGRPHVIEVHPR